MPVKRMVFHKITRPAIERAVHESRDLDRRLVDAQETRRILDRLYGYEVSPVLWKKVMRNLSAGRVQSVATRLAVERERARMRFRTASYWDLASSSKRRRKSGRRSAPRWSRSTVGVWLGERTSARTGRSTGLTQCGWTSRRPGSWRQRLASASFAVRSVEEKPWRRTPRTRRL